MDGEVYYVKRPCFAVVEGLLYHVKINDDGTIDPDVFKQIMDFILEFGDNDGESDDDYDDEGSPLSPRSPHKRKSADAEENPAKRRM